MNETSPHQKQEHLLNEKNLAEIRAKNALSEIEHLTTSFKKQQIRNKEENNVKTLSQKELKVNKIEINKFKRN